MRNILNVNTITTPYELGYTNVGSTGNEIILYMQISSEFTNPYIEITLIDGTTQNFVPDKFENNAIEHWLPFEHYSNQGQIKIKIVEDELATESIVIDIKQDFAEADDIIVKIEDGQYVVKLATEISPTINAIYPVGSVYISATSENPANYFGGTWKLIDKGFTWWASYWNQDSEKSPFTPTSNISAYELRIIRTGHDIRIRLDVTTSVSLSDTAVNFGTIDWDALGATSLYYSLSQVVCGTDTGNAVVNITFDYGGNVQAVDIVSKSGSSSVASGASIRMNTVVNIIPSNMLDRHCNKFYWKRTE